MLMAFGLTAQFVQNVWIESYDPTIEDSYRKALEVDVSYTTTASVGSKMGVPDIWDVGSTSGIGDPGHGRNRAIQYVHRCSAFIRSERLTRTTAAMRYVLGAKHWPGLQIHQLADPTYTSGFLFDYRELYMKSGQGFLLVFSITSLSSLTELHALRDQILRIKDASSVPIVLVGNKSDLEDDRAVSRSRAFAVSQSWGRVPYYETSAKRRANVDEVFRDLCRQIIRKDMEDARRAERNGEGARNSGGAGSGGPDKKRSRKRADKGGSPCTIL
jgi:Ras-related protein Rap-1B